MYNILIVDDERIERNGIIMLLKRLSINAGIVEAANGKEAYEYLCSDEAEHIDILLTDVKMPFMDGITLIKKLNEDNIKLKTIIFSGYNEFEYAKLAVKLGVKDYILKPVDPVEFENTIKKVCAELDEERIHTSNYNKQADFVKQFYLYSLLNKADTKGILENDDFLRSYNRLILIEFNTDFFGKYDGGDANILTLADCMGDIEYHGGFSDGPERWIPLNHTILINRLLGYKNRVAMTNRPKHDPNPESNEVVYNFFKWYLLDYPINN